MQCKILCSFNFSFLHFSSLVSKFQRRRAAPTKNYDLEPFFEFETLSGKGRYVEGGFCISTQCQIGGRDLHFHPLPIYSTHTPFFPTPSMAKKPKLFLSSENYLALGDLTGQPFQNTTCKRRAVSSILVPFCVKSHDGTFSFVCPLLKTNPRCFKYSHSSGNTLLLLPPPVSAASSRKWKRK